MAKKGARVLLGLVCDQCKNQNYVTEKNKINNPNPLKLKKYCKKCNQLTIHIEKKKLH